MQRVTTPTTPPFYKTPTTHPLLLHHYPQTPILKPLLFSLSSPPKPTFSISFSHLSSMAQPQVQVHTTATHRYEGGVNPPQYRYETRGGGGSGGGVRTLFPENGPSTAQVIAILAGVPIGGTLLFLAGISLIGSLIGLAVATPLFILFSPILVPAAITIGLAVAGILMSVACGLTGLMSFSWLLNYIRETRWTVPEQMDSAKRRMADMAGYVGQKTKEVGQDIQTRAQEAKRT
ncbi:Oleosin [Sesbania bispinosa]|nr:Oleosin [Sesbania bispinosa]